MFSSVVFKFNRFYILHWDFKLLVSLNFSYNGSLRINSVRILNYIIIIIMIQNSACIVSFCLLHAFFVLNSPFFGLSDCSICLNCNKSNIQVLFSVFECFLCFCLTLSSVFNCFQFLSVCPVLKKKPSCYMIFNFLLF